jgi:hypothetical protein
MLREAATIIDDHLHPGVRPFRIALKKAVAALNDISRSDMLSLTGQEVNEFLDAVSYFETMRQQHFKGE